MLSTEDCLEQIYRVKITLTSMDGIIKHKKGLRALSSGAAPNPSLLPPPLS